MFTFNCRRIISSECLALFIRAPRLLLARTTTLTYVGTPTSYAIQHPAEQLLRLAKEKGLQVTDKEFAKYLDDNDEMNHIRKQFHVPRVWELLEESETVDGPAIGVDPNKECVYFAGQSIGLQPVGAKQLVDEEMEKWRKRGLYGRETGERPWISIEDTVVEQSALLIGAKNPSLEVVIMNGLSMNIHIGLTAFYQPTTSRHKILIEDGIFPSDYYAVQSQIQLHGHDPAQSLIIVKPREGEETLRTEDIVAKIMEEGDSIALVYIPGIQFITGQAFDMKTITEAAHSKGCYIGTDLAHAIGNVELHLTDWGVDFAIWCNYKYVCASPGGVSGFYVHQKHAYNFDLPRMVGWWAHKRETRFNLDNCLDLRPGAGGFAITTLPALETVTLIAALKIFKQFDMKTFRKKSHLLTGYCELLLKNLSPEQVHIVTPSDPEQRGCCLGVRFSCSGDEVCKKMLERGIALQCFRRIVRITPSPLYNMFSEVLHFYTTLVEVLNDIE
ncbi:kynureninase-like isoform X2 [Dysidea avara]|uniref:kynureninase-like isoform X2 n=1 Tax=Dysidea avara TaxID=196820 RepID=UPI00333413F3